MNKKYINPSEIPNIENVLIKRRINIIESIKVNISNGLNYIEILAKFAKYMSFKLFDEYYSIACLELKYNGENNESEK